MQQPTEPKDRRLLGLSMEEQAWAWLQGSGNRTLIEQNYSWRGGEIDLIFEETRAGGGVELVFCEVRTRNTSGISPLDAISFPKIQRLRRTAAHFLSTYYGPAHTLRFDFLFWEKGRWTLCVDAWRG